MNKFDIAGLLMTYSERCRKATDEEHLEDIIKKLIQELEIKLSDDEWGD